MPVNRDRTLSNNGISGKLWIFFNFIWFLWIFDFTLLYLFIGLQLNFCGYFAFFSLRMKAIDIIPVDLESPERGLHFWFFSIFSPFPYMVTWKFSHIQEKSVAKCISIKFYSFCYFYNFCWPWEYITYSEHPLLTLVCYKSNSKQEKPTAGCAFINIYCFYNF